MNRRNLAIVATGAALVLVLAPRQLASIAAYGDFAVKPSVPAALHAAAPKLLRPFIGDAYAQMAVLAHDGDVAGALAILKTLPESKNREEAEGNAAAMRGDRDTALGHYLNAGDIWHAEDIVATSERLDHRQALAEQKRLVDVLGKNGAQSDLIADAWYELGILQRTVADEGIDPATNSRDALASFEHGLEQAPNREGWLLAAAGQALKIGDDARAERYFTRVTEIAPGRADAYGGLAIAAAHEGNCALAKTRLDAWRARRATATALHPPWLDDRYGAFVRACTSGKAVTVRVTPAPSPPPRLATAAPASAPSPSTGRPSTAPASPAPLRMTAAPLSTAAQGTMPARPLTMTPRPLTTTPRPPTNTAPVPKATAPPSPTGTASGPQILSVVLSPSSLSGNSSITGTVETSADVVKVVASLGTMGSMNVPMVHPGLFSTTTFVPFLPPFVHGKYGVTFTATDAQGRSVSGEWPVYVLNK